ncbi:MAG: hypothetical protein RL100_914 [Actinomycetota bacterium]|jgi:hypothetical protein
MNDKGVSTAELIGAAFLALAIPTFVVVGYIATKLFGGY